MDIDTSGNRTVLYTDVDTSSRDTVWDIRADTERSLTVRSELDDLIVLDTKNRRIDINMNTIDVSTQNTGIRLKDNAEAALSISAGDDNVLLVGTDNNGTL